MRAQISMDKNSTEELHAYDRVNIDKEKEKQTYIFKIWQSSQESVKNISNSFHDFDKL